MPLACANSLARFFACCCWCKASICLVVPDALLVEVRPAKTLLVAYVSTTISCRPWHPNCQGSIKTPDEWDWPLWDDRRNRVAVRLPLRPPLLLPRPHDSPSLAGHEIHQRRVRKQVIMTHCNICNVIKNLSSNANELVVWLSAIQRQSQPYWALGDDPKARSHRPPRKSWKKGGKEVMNWCSLDYHPCLIHDMVLLSISDRDLFVHQQWMNQHHHCNTKSEKLFSTM